MRLLLSPRLAADLDQLRCRLLVELRLGLYRVLEGLGLGLGLGLDPNPNPNPNPNQVGFFYAYNLFEACPDEVG